MKPFDISFAPCTGASPTAAFVVLHEGHTTLILHLAQLCACQTGTLFLLGAGLE